MKKETRICHLTSVHPPFDIRILIKECATLSEAGYQVHLVYLGASKCVAQNVIMHSAGDMPQSRLVRILVGSWKVFRRAWSLNADIYHFHDPELIFAGLLFKMLSKKVIYDVHEDVPKQILSKEWIPDAAKKLISRTTQVIEDFAVGFFDAVVAVTPSIAARFSGKCKNTITINNYPLDYEITPDASGWKNKERAVCYIGGISQIRGIDEMLEAIRLTESKLILAGEFYPSELEIRQREKDGWRNTEYQGVVPRSGLKPILARSMAGLVLFHPVPNHIDARPNKIFEYMAAGIPVIGSDFPRWREIIVNGNCGICVDPLSPLAIADAIKWLVEHPEEAAEMGRNGRRLVKEEYNWEREKGKLLALYNQLQPT